MNTFYHSTASPFQQVMPRFPATNFCLFGMEDLSNYCFCEFNQPCVEFAQPIDEPKNTSSKRRRIIHTIDFDDKVCKLYSNLRTYLDTDGVFIHGKNKAQACTSKDLSKRRSRYTGVTRNSANYQTLIVINGKKTYVDTFSEELLAAITFDFYSMLLHGKRAATNFTYKAEEVREMVDSFISNQKVFKPQAFVAGRKVIV